MDASIFTSLPYVAGFLVFLLIIFIASRYRTVSANEAMVITGAGVKDGLKVIKAGGALVLPIIQQEKRLSLSVHTLNVQTPEVYTQQGVPVMVDGVSQIKVKGDIESITTAAEQFLGKDDEELQHIARETLEGHLRAILGQMTVEEIYKNRDKFAQDVQDVAVSDLNKMGLQIVSFTIKDVRDKNGYLDALGRPQIAAVVRDAEIAEANARRDQQIAKAQAREQGQKADYIAETNIAEANKEMEVKKAVYKQEQDMKKAEADQAYKLQEAKSLQKVTEEEMQIKVIEREKQIEVEAKEIARKANEYDANVKKKADADRYAIEQQAEADKVKKIREAEAKKFEIETKAQADAEQVKLAGQASATATEVEGLAAAKVIKEKGLAEAEAKDAIAEAMKKYGEAAMAEMIIKQFPEIAKAIAYPLGNIEKLTVIDSGSGKNGGANKVTNYVTDLIGTLPETVGSLTGVDLMKMLENFANKGSKDNGGNVIDNKE